jgi:hypothetical protein
MIIVSLSGRPIAQLDVTLTGAEPAGDEESMLTFLSADATMPVRMPGQWIDETWGDVAR